MTMTFCFSPAAFSPKRVDIVVWPDAGYLLPRASKGLLKLLRGLDGSQRFRVPDLTNFHAESGREIGAPAHMRQPGLCEGRSLARIADVRIYIAVPHQIEVHGLILSPKSSGLSDFRGLASILPAISSAF